MKPLHLLPLLLAACFSSTPTGPTTGLPSTSGTSSGTTSTSGSDGTSSGTTEVPEPDVGADSMPEQDACDRALLCGLFPGTALECVDTLYVCTGDLPAPAFADWMASIENCLQLADCANFEECVLELSCSPIPPVCGPECDYCWTGTQCDPQVLGNGDGCDCDCQFGYDSDCG